MTSALPDDASGRSAITRRELLAMGWTDMAISRACRSGRLIRLARGVYAEPARQDELGVRMDALQHRFSTSLVAVLDTAARLHGLPAPWPVDPRTHLAAAPGHEHSQRAGFCLHTWKLLAADCTEVDGCSVTTLERTLVDLMCLRDRLSAVAALDAALRSGRVDRTVLQRLRRTTVRRRGAARSRPWWTDADPRAESPLESRVRVRAIDAGYPPDDLQREFEVPGGRPVADFVWKQPNGRWLVGEADGREFHEAPQALLRDRRRANALVGRGDLDVVRFTWGDTIHPQRVGATLAPVLGPPRDSRRS